MEECRAFTTTDAFSIFSGVWLPSSYGMEWLSRSALYFSGIVPMSERNTSIPLALPSTAAPLRFRHRRAPRGARRCRCYVCLCSSFCVLMKKGMFYLIFRVTNVSVARSIPTIQNLTTIFDSGIGAFGKFIRHFTEPPPAFWKWW